MLKDALPILWISENNFLSEGTYEIVRFVSEELWLGKQISPFLGMANFHFHNKSQFQLKSVKN